MTDKHLIIGLGTGRSGTMSLAKFLDLQHHAYFVHEGAHNVPKWLRHTTGKYLPWEFNQKSFDEWLEGLYKRSSNVKYFGDVGASVLPYVGIILEQNPAAVFICMKRERDLVVQSFLKITIGTNHWNKNDIFRELNYFDGMFPKMDADSKKEAIEKYWDMYYEQCDKYSEKYPKNFFIFDIEKLNSIEGRCEILDAAGISESDREVNETIHANKSFSTLPHLIFQILIMVVEIPRKLVYRMYSLLAK